MESSVSRKGLGRGLALVTVALGLIVGIIAVAASESSAQSSPRPDGPERVFALTIRDELLLFDGDNPRAILRRSVIRGLVPGESLIGIDFRPANGLLYGVGDRNNVYTIDTTTSRATRVSTLSVPLSGNRFGIDFNPVPDRLRIVSDLDQNLRANVDDGSTTVDGPLAYAAGDRNAGRNPNVTSVAYTNNTPPSPRPAEPPSTTLYDIDTTQEDLVIQNPPNDGTLNTVGALGISVGPLVGFDIVTTGGVGGTNRAFAALAMSNNTSMFVRVNLNTGRVTSIGQINGRGTRIEGLAIPIGQR